MSILIADSGSSKTDWYFINEKGDNITFRSEGMNPYYHSDEDLRNILENEVLIHSDLTNITEIYFYGAGCTDPVTNNRIKDAIKSIWENNPKIEIYSDLLGAARACCGTNKGIVGILGTGSNSCLYDGNKITDQIPALGYAIGDEGSAAHLGKKILQNYFYREMPPDLSHELESKYDMSRDKVLDKIYHKEHPNRYVAEFSRFCKEFKDHIFIQRILVLSFTEFLERHILKYESSEDLEISLVGSIAFVYRDMIEKLIEERSLKPGKILKSPIEELAKFHLQKLGNQK